MSHFCLKPHNIHKLRSYVHNTIHQLDDSIEEIGEKVQQLINTFFTVTYHDKCDDCSPEDVHVEALLQVAEIFSDLQLAETFTGDEKPSNGTGTVLNKPLPDQVAQSLFWVSDIHMQTL